MRALKGATDSMFFAIDSETGKQIDVRKIGEGRIGVESGFSRIKLI